MARKTAVRIEIYPDLCKGCRICLDVCRFGVFEMSRERGKQGYLLPAVAHPENCTDCELCELSCPDMAIEIRG